MSILYAAYVGGALLDHVSAEGEDAAIAKLMLDYPELPVDRLMMEVVDKNHEGKEGVVEAISAVEPVEKTVVEEPQASSTTAKPKPFVVIEGDVEIVINVTNTQISKGMLEEIEKAEMFIIKKKAG